MASISASYASIAGMGQICAGATFVVLTLNQVVPSFLTSFFTIHSRKCSVVGAMTLIIVNTVSLKVITGGASPSSPISSLRVRNLYVPVQPLWY